MKRILIDGRFVGVGDSQTRYVLELVKGVLEQDQENQYTLLLRPVGIKDTESFLKLEIRTSKKCPSAGQGAISEVQVLKSKYPNLMVRILDIPHYSFGEQTKLLRYLNEEKFDLVHFTQFNHPVRYRGKYVITIQDLTLVGHLHRQNLVKKVAFGTVMKSAAKDSAKIIAISKTTMDDVIDYYGVPKGKFDIIYHGVDHQNYNMTVKSRINEINEFKKKYNISDEFILYTGMWKRHKNILRMLKAFEQFRVQNADSRIQLVLVGKVDKKEPEVIREISRINSDIKDSIITTGFIDEKELPIAYAGALAYCIPSLSEGFGWPPLEAMACGTPVIASGESCIPEILGDGPLYFDAYNTSDIVEKMKTITTNTDLRKDLIKNGLDQVQKYNWEDTAKLTYAVYEELLK